MMTNPSPDLWTFTCDGVTLSAAGAGVSDVVRRRVSQGLDTCQLVTLARAGDAAPLFALGRTVTVDRAGVGWFAGRVTSAPATGSGQGEEQTLELSGPWWYLEQLVCQQVWSLRGGAGSGLLSRLVLGQAADGTRLTTGEVIRETLQYAIDAGAPFQIGIIEPDVYPPLDTRRDVTCAEVIRAILRWHPDCAAWFDYGSAPTPTFHCRARANLPAVTLTLGQPPLAAVRGLTARPELATPAAVLHYTLAIPAADGGSAPSLDVATDTAPAGATGWEFGAAVGTIPLLGGGIGAAVAGGAAEIAARTRAAFSRSAGASAPSLAAAQPGRAAAPHTGSVELIEEDAGAAGEGLGRTLNVAGGMAVGAAMGALIVAEEVRVAEGRTTWTLGAVAEAEGGALREALRTTRPGVEGRESGGMAWLGVAAGEERVSGKANDE